MWLHSRAFIEWNLQSHDHALRVLLKITEYCSVSPSTTKCVRLSVSIPFFTRPVRNRRMPFSRTSFDTFVIIIITFVNPFYLLLSIIFFVESTMKLDIKRNTILQLAILSTFMLIIIIGSAKHVFACADDDACEAVSCSDCCDDDYTEYYRCVGNERQRLWQ